MFILDALSSFVWKFVIRNVFKLNQLLTKLSKCYYFIVIIQILSWSSTCYHDHPNQKYYLVWDKLHDAELLQGLETLSLAVAVCNIFAENVIRIIGNIIFWHRMFIILFSQITRIWISIQISQNISINLNITIPHFTIISQAYQYKKFGTRQ